jgi:hypothetical protein
MLLVDKPATIALGYNSTTLGRVIFRFGMVVLGNHIR